MTPRDILRDALTGPLPGATVKRVLELLDGAGLAVVGKCDRCDHFEAREIYGGRCYRWDACEGCTRWQERKP